MCHIIGLEIQSFFVCFYFSHSSVSSVKKKKKEEKKKLPPIDLLLKSAISCGLEEHTEHRNLKYLCALLLSIKGVGRR